MSSSSTGTQEMTPRDSLLVLSGYGLRIAVERGHLVISDGIGQDRRSGRLHRATYVQPLLGEHNGPRPPIVNRKAIERSGPSITV